MYEPLEQPLKLPPWLVKWHAMRGDESVAELPGESVIEFTGEPVVEEVVKEEAPVAEAVLVIETPPVADVLPPPVAAPVEAAVVVETLPVIEAAPVIVETPPPPKKPVVAIGDKMPDGTIYAGISPDTNAPMYAAPKDAGRMSFNRAAKQALKYKVKTGGKLFKRSYTQDFRVPSKAELGVLFENRNKGALKDTFNQSAADIADLGGYYWSSQRTRLGTSAALHFKDGRSSSQFRIADLNVRFVR